MHPLAFISYISAGIIQASKSFNCTLISSFPTWFLDPIISISLLIAFSTFVLILQCALLNFPLRLLWFTSICISWFFECSLHSLVLKYLLPFFCLSLLPYTLFCLSYILLYFTLPFLHISSFLFLPSLVLLLLKYHTHILTYLFLSPHTYI